MELYKKTSYISGGNLLSSRNKKAALKKFLIFQEGTLKSQAKKFPIF